jgi:hypothetical protein
MKRPWPLDKLLRRDRNAATVFLAIVALSSGLRRVATTRGRLRAVCGLSEKRITSAIETLDAGRWVVRRYGRRRGRQWYRLSVPRCFPVDLLWGAFGAVGRKTTLSKASQKVKNDPQQTVCCGAENDLHSLTGVGPAGCLAGRPAVPDPISQLEQQRLAEIRTRRLGRTSCDPAVTSETR